MVLPFLTQVMVFFALFALGEAVGVSEGLGIGVGLADAAIAEFVNLLWS